MKALVVEDDVDIRSLVVYFLNKVGYEVEEASDGLAGLKAIKRTKPDIIILDIMLPNLDGVNLCSMVREVPEKYGTPIIIMLTAKTEVEDVLKGLETGADDYLKKPFDPRELIMRIDKLTERKGIKSKDFYEYGSMKIDTKKHTIFLGENEVELSKKEYDLILYLVKNVGLVVSREQIIDKIWKSMYYPGDRTVDVYIGKLREKLPDIAEDIKTVKGVGYKLKEKR